MKETYNLGGSFESEDWQDNESQNVLDEDAALENDAADGERQSEDEVVIGVAEEGDYGTIVKITDDWAKYFQEKGIRQWGTITYDDGTTKTYAERYPEEYYKGLQEKGTPIVVAKDPNGTVLASLALLSEDKLWPESVPGDSYFIHHFVANREAKHNDGTRRILQTVAESAINNDVGYIRLDCSSDNQILCGIYEGYGFSLVEKGKLPDGYNYSKYEISPQDLLENLSGEERKENQQHSDSEAA